MPEVAEEVETKETPVADKPAPEKKDAPVVPGTPEAEAAAVEELQALIDAQRDGTAPKRDEDEDEPAEVEETEEAKEQDKKAAAPDSPSAGISLKLTLRASKVMDEDEILEYSDDPKSLERLVSALERRAKDSSTQKPAAKAEEREAEEELSGLSDDDVAEPIAKWAKQIVGVIAKEREKNKALVAQLEKFSDAYALNRMGDKFDIAVTRLGQSDLFGDGEIDSLDEGSEQYKNRLELFKARSEVQAQYRARHEKMPSEAKLVERAYRLAFPQKIEQNANKSLAEKLKAGAKKLSVPPRSRKAATDATPDELALEAMQAIIDSRQK